MGDFARRAGVALVAIPAVGALVWAGGLPLALFLAAIAALAAWEFYRLASAGGVRPFAPAGAVLATAIPVALHTNYTGVTAIPLAAFALAMLAVFAGAVWLRQGERPLSAVSATAFGVLYCGGMIAFGYALRHHRFTIGAAAGTALVGLPLVVTWITDTGAYAFGKAFGRRKLLPAVSPGKTVAGAIGGLASGVAATALYTAYVLRPHANLTMTSLGIALFGIAVSTTGQIGDLAESLLKREAGVKDSSRLIPGHGGVLDRIDSLLFALPVSYVLVAELMGPVP